MRTTQQARSTERRQQIVAGAWRMFSATGYHATSVNAIVAALGISKGSFYHHFESKEAVLNAAVEALIQRSLEEHAERVATQQLSTLSEVAQLLQAGWRVPPAELALYGELVRALLEPANAIVRDKLLATEQRLLRPLLAGIIRRGHDEGVFAVRDAELAADFVFGAMTVGYLDLLRASFAEPVARSELRTRVEMMIDAVERLLGAAPDSLIGAIDVEPLVELLSGVVAGGGTANPLPAA